jgi:hypothetical protein
MEGTHPGYSSGVASLKVKLGDPAPSMKALLLFTISAAVEAKPVPPDAAEVELMRGGSIHIERPGRAMISVESGTDFVLLRCVPESLPE